jgi:methylglutamate dehydrogenase subunit D
VADASNLVYRPGRLGRAQTPAGLTVSELTHFNLATVIARKGQSSAASQAAQVAYGASLPMRPVITSGSEMTFVWSGPGQWLALSAALPGDTENRLGTTLGAHASIFDQGGSRNLLQLSGPRVRDVLAKGMSVDLHPRVFKTGDVAVTMASHLAVHLWQVDDLPVYRLLVVRTYFESLWRWLASSAAEYGCDVQAPRPYSPHFG